MSLVSVEHRIVSNASYLAIHSLHHLARYGNESIFEVEPRSNISVADVMVALFAFTYSCLRLQDWIGGGVLRSDSSAWLALTNEWSLFGMAVSR